MTPFQALYGYEPPSVKIYLPGSTSVANVDQDLRNRDELLTVLKKNLEKAQSRMKKYYDLKHTERKFEVGDLVYLKLQPYRQQSAHKRVFHKLSAKYFGPFEVLEKVGSVAYKLKLPAYAKIHDVFHVSLLRKKLGANVTAEAHLPHLSEAGTVKWEPEAVLQTRLVKRRGEAAAQWLIKWMGAEAEDATWEFADHITRRFPEFKH
ncbi:PREDICTED: uncharacterized protein LOC101292670 [Fragaria vesca subsp. vesca]